MKPVLFLTLVFCLARPLFAQDTCRYAVELSLDIPYATNISIFTGTVPAEEELLVDIYEPVEDTDSLRPLVICLHGGFYFPRFFNGFPIGSNRDSAVVESCRRFAEQGYVAFAPTYRLGWLPLSDTYAVRLSTFLQAQYRAMQDVRACIRFARKTVAEQGNPYRLDPNRIIVWGFGSGAITALSAAYLNRYEELLLPSFIDPELGSPFIDTTMIGNPYGTTSKPLCLANHPEYSSAFNMVVNVGGAIGDTSWIGNEPPGSVEPHLVSFHVISDSYIPFTSCSPTFQHPWLFIQTFFGSRLVQGRTNQLGINQVMEEALADTGSLAQYLNQYVTVQANIPFSAIGCQSSTYATTHLYPFIPPNQEGQNYPRIEHNPWDWWNEAIVDSLITVTYPQLNTSQILENGLLLNPGMSAEKGRAYLDTIFTFLRPRLDAIWDNSYGPGPCSTSTIETTQERTSAVSVFPNPATGAAVLHSTKNNTIRAVYCYNLLGQLVKKAENINGLSYMLEGGALARGTYIVKVKLDKGWGIVKMIFN